MRKVTGIVICFILLYPVPAYAVDYTEEIHSIVQEYNINGILQDDSLNIGYVIEYVKGYIRQNSELPIKITIKILGILLIAAVIKAIQSDGTDKRIYEQIYVLVIFTMLIDPLQQVIDMVTTGLISVKNFMIVFLPVYAGISAASGEVVTSTVYTGFFLTGMITVANIILDIIIPSLNIYYALIVANAVSPYIKLKSASDFYLKAIKWLMRSLVSVICFLLAVQTAISQGKDTIIVKTGKILTGSAIPVIGSVLQDAVSSVFAGMEAIKGFAGAAGIVGVVMIFASPLLLIIIYCICMNFLYICCDIFDNKGIGECVKGFVNITELILSVIILFVVMFIFSITIMISMTNGV